MADKKMFIIPIYLFDSEIEEENERLGINEDEPMDISQVTLHTIYVTSYWIDNKKNTNTGTKDIVFYVDGNSFRTPYTQKILQTAIWPAMQWRAANDGPSSFVSPN